MVPILTSATLNHVLAIIGHQTVEIYSAVPLVQNTGVFLVRQDDRIIIPYYVFSFESIFPFDLLFLDFRRVVLLSSMKTPPEAFMLPVIGNYLCNLPTIFFQGVLEGMS